MPALSIYQILKIFAPRGVIVGVLLFTYHRGEQHIQQKWDLREEELTNASVEVLYQAKQHNFNVTNELIATKQQITAISNANEKTITDLTISNRKLLANRMQRNITTDCSSSGMSEVAGTSGGSNGTGTIAGWWLSEASGEAIITDYEYADKLNESLRACRTYVTKLKEVLE